MKTFKGNLLKHLWLKLLAILLAVIIWLIVVNVDDYMVTKTIRGIPVEQLHGDDLEELGQIYTVTNGETVDVSVKGPRSTVERMTPDDFYASADLSQLSVTNTAEINVTLRENVSNVTITRLNSTMTLSLEEKVTKDLPVTVVTVGEVREGFALGTCTAKPNIVTIEGAASVVENVTELRAVVDVDKAYMNFTSEVALSCLNTYGESMEGKKITLSDDTVLISVPVYPTKEISVRVEPSGTPQDGYSVTEVNFNPQTIRIAGDAVQLKDITEVLIDDISVADEKETLEENVRVNDYLPVGIVTADDGAQIAVSITIEPKQVKTITVTKDDISIIGTTTDYDYSISMAGPLHVQVSGHGAELEEVSLARLSPRVDATGLSSGQYAAQLVFNESDIYSIDDIYSVVLTIEEKKTEE